MKKHLNTINYLKLLIDIKSRIQQAQYHALKTVNTELVMLYWDIGKIIVEKRIDAKHGAAIVDQLVTDLQAEFPAIRGFSRRNIFYMREFYSLYCDDQRVQPLVAQISWTHNIVIMSKCKDNFEREFYYNGLNRDGLFC